MAYADQQGMSTNRLVSIIVVILLHAFLGYALVTGLAFEAVQQVKKSLNVIDVKEEKPPEEEPPPPPPEQKQVSPPPVTQTISPVAPVNNAVPPSPPIPSVPFNPLPPSPAPVAAPPPPPPPVAKRPKPIPKGNPGSWANSGDYPSSEMSKEHEGTTGFSVTVGPNGRVTSCSVTRSSGWPILDKTACSKITARARFDPALDGAGNPTTGTYSNSIRWQIPKD